MEILLLVLLVGAGLLWAAGMFGGMTRRETIVYIPQSEPANNSLGCLASLALLIAVVALVLVLAVTISAGGG